MNSSCSLDSIYALLHQSLLIKHSIEKQQEVDGLINYINIKHLQPKM